MYSSFEDQPFIQFAQAAVTPPDGVREEWLFWSDLATALDIPLFGSSTASMTPRALWKQLVDGGQQLSWEELIASPHGVIYAEKSNGHLDAVIATADGAVHLAPDDFVTALRDALQRPVSQDI